MIHLMGVALTAPGDRRAALFAEAVCRCLRGLSLPVHHLDQWSDVSACSVEEGDAVVYFNPPEGGEHDRRALRFLCGVRASTVIFTVALDERSRQAPGASSIWNTYDLSAAERRLGAGDAQVGVAATEFTYEALAAIQPTLNSARLRLFISYRREDGELLADSLKRELALRRRHESFLDLDDIPAGSDFARVIDEQLNDCDVLVLLDTPRAAHSPYIEHEVVAALASHVPVVWVMVGPSLDDDRPRRALPVPPAHTPAMRLTEVEGERLPPQRVDEILELACRLAHEHTRRARSALRRIRDTAEQRGLVVTPLDLRRCIFEVREPDADELFPRRPRIDIVQVFGRHPSPSDRRELVEWLEQRRMGPHEDNRCRAFDAAVLLDPMPVCVGGPGDDHTVVANGSAYGDWVGRPRSGQSTETAPTAGAGRGGRPPGLLLCSAFPDDPAAQGRVLAAVRAVVAMWLARGGRATFGGHPTVTPLVRELARRAGPRRPGPVVRAYQSEEFRPISVLQGEDSFLETVWTAQREDRTASLTLMRQEMVHGSDALAAVFIGGRTAEGGSHRPGLDEELALARAAEVPCFVLGAPGGRAAELAAHHRSEGWSQLGNGLGPDNERLQEDDDYEDLADLVWRRVVG